MSDIVERLRNRQLHDMEYVDAMTREAADEIERLKAERDLWKSRTEQGGEIIMGNVKEIEQLRLTFASRQETGVDRNTPEQAYLQIVEGWLRDNRGIHFPEGAVDDLCERISRRALEPKP